MHALASKDASASCRAAVICALRHALFSPHLRTPPLLPLLPDFLALVTDPDLGVRRQALLTVSALAHAHPALIPHALGSDAHGQTGMAANVSPGTSAGSSTRGGGSVSSSSSMVLRAIYAETKVDPSRVRTVDFGPFKHKIDDGSMACDLFFINFFYLLLLFFWSSLCWCFWNNFVFLFFVGCCRCLVSCCCGWIRVSVFVFLIIYL